MAIVQSLWIGDKLSLLEQTAIKSHLQNGHEFHLYVYDKIGNIPEGTTVKDGRKILPKSEIFCYKKGVEKGSFSAFSNCFRYKLLMDHGNWWVDMDVICRKNFLFDQEYVIASERDRYFRCKAATCVIKAPQELMEYCFKESMQVNRNDLRWAQIGPDLLTKGVDKFQFKKYIVPFTTFCPVDWFDVKKLFQVDDIDISQSFAIHLWNEMIRRCVSISKFRFSDDSFYGKLIRKYNVQNKEILLRQHRWY